MLLFLSLVGVPPASLGLVPFLVTYAAPSLTHWKLLASPCLCRLEAGEDKLHLYLLKACFCLFLSLLVFGRLIQVVALS